ncbi:hypothetical protein [Pseudobacter ginsenosidimutans]|uniref:Uncharacterized protein n=1 Tax=Pseudobacter ginsenosidimutans TaxID=661488 RepID=A0A4Q7MYR9_9BACT|nr:hypothetical protein [Pseudobacter ginsenosidimutans]QEC40893.1 hypothetical protein FSB84_03980 [Pseudobacter ginsenosidimutans]RZS72373.1 hypothetical protein EV199_4292 [Pseudobacter ginsenosidimutans]
MRELFARGFCTLLIPMILLTGCRSGQAYPYESENGINAIIYQLQAQFGLGGRYASIHMRYEDSTALVLTITGVAERNKDSLEVRQLRGGKWKQISSTNLGSMIEAPIFFSLDSVASFKKIPELIRSSIAKMNTELKKSDLHVKEILVNAPSYDPDGDPVRIIIFVEPQEGTEKFEYSYNSNGLLKDVLQY